MKLLFGTKINCLTNCNFSRKNMMINLIKLLKESLK